MLVLNGTQRMDKNNCFYPLFIPTKLSKISINPNGYELELKFLVATREYISVVFVEF